ncbi:hypothetical protein BGZ61DRAFT_541678 [Ilyonectria robusta]|uniref:uncharacterized protein n=1 Tax=Ilyonectria robusta TaxID=1079257 RepID=UPI001E8D3FC7|nr:uncharacterized protein BGZ61DRAFT_541678 [Ilyonectria robusta]KAH8653047.1 hypothetical protein BGZ61DRAFT_541678 [Ilyonectria robusta]
MSSRISKRPLKSRDILKSTASKLISAVSAEGFEVPVSTANSLVLAAAIKEFGFEVMPYSRCIAHGRVCKMLDNGSKKCGFCTDKGRPCDGTGIPLHSLTRVISEARRLGDKELELEEEFLKKRAALRAA